MTPRLSVLIPFYHDDPGVLLRSLSEQRIDPATVEIRVMDDGSGDAALTQSVEQAEQAMNLPTTFTTATQNRGRSATRNALQSDARADWVLFLDADMRVDHPDFLSRYIELIESDDCDIIFGGFDVEDHATDRDTDLHRVLSHSSDCMDAKHRKQNGAQHVASSNLCVRKSVMIEQPFDPDFHGWGWEDSEWAARVSQSHRLRHIDNPRCIWVWKRRKCYCRALRRRARTICATSAPIRRWPNLYLCFALSPACDAYRVTSLRADHCAPW